MLRAVNWSEKVGQLFGGHGGRILRILILFLCSLAVLVGIYRARGVRIEKEKLNLNKPLKHVASNFLSPVSTTKWVIVGNPDADSENGSVGVGEQYVCSVSRVAKEAGWKTIIIGDKLECCRMPDCYPIHRSQFLRMSYRTASVLKNLTESGKNAQVYKEAIRNLAFIWVIHRGARYVFDAYVDEYISANVPIPKFEEELSRQLHTLALDESLALVEDRSRSRGSLFRNPYSHFGRPDVRLLPGGPGTNSGSSSNTFHHAHYHHGYTPLNLAHRHSQGNGNLVMNTSSGKSMDFPAFRICEVRPPSIEKFLEIDEGWWDLRAPALVLPGDTMPPLCTRNTLFSPDVFWALPLLPDYASAGETDEILELPQNASRIPPWYIRGLWSQSLLGDLGGSIRLTLSRVPTLQLNQDYFAGGDYEPSSSPSSNSSNKTTSSKLLKRWHCRSRSTFRCLLLMSKELSKSIYLRKNDLALIEAWVTDLKSIHYAEPPMLPRRRSHTNPCLGADGLHGVSFFPALEPNTDFNSEDFIGKRNDTLKGLLSKTYLDKEDGSRDKRETLYEGDLPSGLTPPQENSTFYPIDWSAYASQVTDTPSSVSLTEDTVSSASGRDSYYAHFRETLKQLDDSSISDFDTLTDHSSVYTRRVLPFEDKAASSYASAAVVPDPRNEYAVARSAKQLLQQFPSKSTSNLAPEEFPIQKAMAETICPGFGPLIPYQPETIHQDILLIVVFTNQHYDLIPTLEVLYRSSFPNMLYCGHPHVSVDLFLRKYQSVEHRSFSFLPTYTRATYECVLGAMEMNYEVKGYAVITDETLMKSWNIKDLDKNKIWVSSSAHDSTRHVPLTRNSWPKLDPRGQKLPRLLDGIINAWKLFSYILVGQDSWILEPKGIIKKRSVDESHVSSATTESDVDDEETLETGAASYVPVQGSLFQWNINDQNNETNPEARLQEKKNSLQGDGEAKSTSQWDLSVSDWDSVKAAGFSRPIDLDANSSSDTNSSKSDGLLEDGETSDPEDVEVGEEEDESTSSGVADLISSEGSDAGSEGTPPSIPSSDDGQATTDEMDSVILATPTTPSPTIGNNNPLGDSNSTSIWSEGLLNNRDDSGGSSTGNVGSSTQTPESSVGVPLYHVEHTEPPTPPTWHKPEDMFVPSTTEETPVVNSSVSDTSRNNESSSEKELKGKKDQELLEAQGSLGVTQGANIESKQQQGSSSTTSHPSSSDASSYPSSTNAPGSLPSSTSQQGHLGEENGELRREMDHLLDTLQDIYLNMLGVVAEYKEANESSRSHESSEVGGEVHSLLEDAKSHRISPREFRHIRCSLQDDGHQSDLCATLRSYISTLGQNFGNEIELDYDTIPMYYLPSWSTKPFYSVANVLLHFGVMDELALPLLFRGLAHNSDWVHLNRSPALKVNSKPDLNSQQLKQNDGLYLHPFHLHKVFSDLEKKKLFCSNYLLKVFQM